MANHSRGETFTVRIINENFCSSSFNNVVNDSTQLSKETRKLRSFSPWNVLQYTVYTTSYDDVIFHKSRHAAIAI